MDSVVIKKEWESSEVTAESEGRKSSRIAVKETHDILNDVSSSIAGIQINSFWEPDQRKKIDVAWKS